LGVACSAFYSRNRGPQTEREKGKGGKKEIYNIWTPKKI